MDEPTITSRGPVAGALPDAGEAAARLCPGCGYDLRAATTDRCSECGLLLDRAALQESGFPWAHRKRIGRVRAFVRTVWRVTWDSRSIRHELAKPQDARDAARFRRWNALVVAAALLAFAGLFVAAGDAKALLAEPADGFARPPLPGYLQDLAVPWSAGVTLLPVPPLCLVALAVYLTGAPRAAFRLARFPAEHRERAGAVAGYAAAPLAWLLVAASVLGLDSVLNGVRAWEGGPPMRAVEFLPLIIAALILLLAPAATLLRAGQWAARARHDGPGRAAAAALELLGRVLVGTVVLLGVVPWCVGFLWIVADSAR